MPSGLGVVGDQVHYSSLKGWTPCGARPVEKVILVSDRGTKITCEFCLRYAEGKRLIWGLMDLWSWTVPPTLDRVL